MVGEVVPARAVPRLFCEFPGMAPFPVVEGIFPSVDGELGVVDGELGVVLGPVFVVLGETVVPTRFWACAEVPATNPISIKIFEIFILPPQQKF